MKFEVINQKTGAELGTYNITQFVENFGSNISKVSKAANTNGALTIDNETYEFSNAREFYNSKSKDTKDDSSRGQLNLLQKRNETIDAKIIELQNERKSNNESIEQLTIEIDEDVQIENKLDEIRKQMKAENKANKMKLSA